MMIQKTWEWRDTGQMILLLDYPVYNIIDRGGEKGDNDIGLEGERLTFEDKLGQTEIAPITE